MAIFGRKAWVNPFAKMSIFGLFELFVLIAQGRFFVLEYRKRHFPGLYYLRKKVGKMAIFGPMKKCQFLDFLNFLFSYPRKALFRSRIS